MLNNASFFYFVGHITYFIEYYFLCLFTSLFWKCHTRAAKQYLARVLGAQFTEDLQRRIDTHGMQYTYTVSNREHRHQNIFITFKSK